MQDSHASRHAESDDEATSRSLARLREQIDALDDGILDLIERRLVASRTVAELKSARRDGHLWLRPRREQEVIARLCRRAAMAPAPLVELLWRELMAFSLQVQVRTELVLHGPDPERLAVLARGRFGSAAPIRNAATPAEAVEAARTGEAVAVVALEGAPDWVRDLPPPLSLFDWIRDPEGRPRAAAIARIAPAELPEPAASQKPGR